VKKDHTSLGIQVVPCPESLGDGVCPPSNGHQRTGCPAEQLGYIEQTWPPLGGLANVWIVHPFVFANESAVDVCPPDSCEPSEAK
jgi:hypothetical protein